MTASAVGTYNEATYQGTADASAKEAGVPAPLFSALVATQSDWNPYAYEQGGEIGFGGLTSKEARDQGVNPWNPDENLKGSASQLGAYYKELGNWRDALAAYDQGGTGGDMSQGYPWADKVLKTASNQGFALDPNGNPIPDASGSVQQSQAADAAEAPSSGLYGWLVSGLQRAGWLVLALFMLAIGIWVMIAKGGLSTSKAA